jgi:hypothetical protein
MPCLSTYCPGQQAGRQVVNAGAVDSGELMSRGRQANTREVKAGVVASNE